MSSAQDVIDGVRQLINDLGSDFIIALRWPDAELLRWLDDAQREVVKIKPEANIVTRAFAVAADFPRQRLNPLTAYKLIRVEANVLGIEGNSAPVEILSIQSRTASNVLTGALSVPYFVEPSILPGQMVVLVALLDCVDGSELMTTLTLDGHVMTNQVVSDNANDTKLVIATLALNGVTFSDADEVQLVTGNPGTRAAATFKFFTIANTNADTPVLATDEDSSAGGGGLYELGLFGDYDFGPGMFVVAAEGQSDAVGTSLPDEFDPFDDFGDVYTFSELQSAVMALPVAPDVVRRELQMHVGYFLGTPTDAGFKWASGGVVFAGAAAVAVFAPTEGAERHGSVIRIVERDVLDSFTSSWTRASSRVPGVDYYKSYCMDGNDPLAFWLWPRPVANYNVMVTYVGVPTQLLTVADPLTLSDMYLAPLIDYVSYRALLKEAREAQRTVAEKYLQSFYAALGAHRTIQKALGQNTSRPPDAEA